LLIRHDLLERLAEIQFKVHTDSWTFWTMNPTWFTTVPSVTVTTKGRVLDHIGFDVTDLQGFIKKLEAAGIKLDRPYTKTENGGALAFITDPWGTYIELNERPNPVYLP
jgi:hypothetical protein